MPELEPLPRRPRVPSFEPRTGDFDAMVGRAKHRRRRHVGSATAGLAGVAVAVALATTGGGGAFGLRPVEPVTTPGVTESIEPGESPSPAPSASSPAAPEPSSSQGHGSGAGGGDPDPRPSPSDGPVSGGEQPRRPTVPRPVVVRADVPFDAAKTCDTDPGFVTAAGWCLRYEGPSVVRVTEVHEYRMLACRHVGRGAATLTYRTEQEVDFDVNISGRYVWNWDYGYTFPKRETKVPVGAGRCARWTIEWDATGNDGKPLAPGAYSMSPHLPVADWGDGVGGMAVGAAYSLDVVE